MMLLVEARMYGETCFLRILMEVSFLDSLYSTMDAQRRLMTSEFQPINMYYVDQLYRYFKNEPVFVRREFNK